MTKSISLIAAAVAVAALTTAPALAAKVEKVSSKSITVGGKTYSVSGKRTKVMISGKAGSRDAIKVGMDCDVKGTGEASEISCK